MFEAILDPVMRPLLSLPSFWAIFLISFLITLAITLVYKFTTDQARMRHLKGELKKFQEKMKKARNDPEKLMKLQQESMSLNFELMKHSFKPTLYTFIPIIIIFGWLNASMAFYNIAPGQQFNITASFSPGVVGNASIAFIPANVSLVPNDTVPIVDSQATWTLSADAGTYKATVTHGSDAVEKTFLISPERKYEAPVQTYSGAISKVTVSNEPVHPLEPVSLFGWHPGWLGTYIIFSILLSILLRKILNVV